MIKSKVIYLDKKKNFLRLVRFEKKHISRNYLSWLNNKKNIFSQNRFSKHNYPSSIEYLNKNQREGNFLFAIESKQNSEYLHVGNILLKIDKNNKRGHLSILIGKNKRKGIGTIVWKETIKIAFNNFNCNLVVAGSDSFNKPMIRIFKKSKMKLITMPNYFLHKNKRSNLIISYISKK